MFEILFPAWLTGMLLSLITAPLGAFVVWRKMAYFGDTLAHSALLGVALGIFLDINPYLSIVLLTLILAILMVWLEGKHNFRWIHYLASLRTVVYRWVWSPLAYCKMSAWI